MALVMLVPWSILHLYVAYIGVWDKTLCHIIDRLLQSMLIPKVTKKRRSMSARNPGQVRLSKIVSFENELNLCYVEHLQLLSTVTNRHTRMVPHLNSPLYSLKFMCIESSMKIKKLCGHGAKGKHYRTGKVPNGATALCV